MQCGGKGGRPIAGAGTLARCFPRLALVRWYAGTLLSPPGAGTLARCYAEWPARRWYAELRWYAATLNGRRDAGTLNCAGTLLR